MSEGQKFDKGKVRYGLLPPLALQEVAEVLTAGANKYSPNNWKKVKDLHVRYVDAAYRHLEATRLGETLDGETGRHHLAHAICCLMFLLETEIENEIEMLKEEGSGFDEKYYAGFSYEEEHY